MLYDDIWSQRERTKIEGFGKPYDINQVGGGCLDWFECKGLPFSEWDKPCQWYSSDSTSDHDESSPVYMAQYKRLFPEHEGKGGGAFG